MSSSSTADSEANVVAAYERYPRCSCERRPRLETSHTAANPQRRFLRCPAQSCGFFRWVDPWRPPTQTEDVSSWISMYRRMSKHCEFLEDSVKELRTELNELKCEKERLLVEKEQVKADNEQLNSKIVILEVEKERLNFTIAMIKAVAVCVMVLLISVIFAN